MFFWSGMLMSLSFSTKFTGLAIYAITNFSLPPRSRRKPSCLIIRNLPSRVVAAMQMGNSLRRKLLREPSRLLYSSKSNALLFQK
jgi:hypothetical protein